MHYLQAVKDPYLSSILHKTLNNSVDLRNETECCTTGHDDLKGLRGLYHGKDSLAKRFQFTRFEELYEELTNKRF
jgi:hypothetical protein